MGEGGLINLGELSKPATVLVERISDAVGGIAKPWQTRRVAKAEADAELIRAEGQVRITEMERRALERLVREEGQKQENIENITAKAIPHLSPEAKPENIEKDWLSHFFDRSRLISDDQMQTLWANVLAGEANAPGKFSRRTVELVGTMDKSDAEIFRRVCQCAWMIRRPTLLVYDLDDKILSSFGVNFEALNHLANIGLITFETISTYYRTGLPKRFSVGYHSKVVTLEPPSENEQFNIGHALFTKAGQQLHDICQSPYSEEFFNYTLSKWCAAGTLVSTPIRLR